MDFAQLKERLERVRAALTGTSFGFSDHGAHLEITCPWGNRFRCHAPAAEFGDMELGMPYVEFDAPASSAQRIARFYREIIGAASEVVRRDGAPAAAINAGDGQRLYYRETSAAILPYNGHHIQIYISDFSGPYRRLIDRWLITLETDAHEWRFVDIVDLDTNVRCLPWSMRSAACGIRCTAGRWSIATRRKPIAPTCAGRMHFAVGTEPLCRAIHALHGVSLMHFRDR